MTGLARVRLHDRQEHSMPNQDIIVIGTSAGGIEALKVLVSTLPHDLNASLFVVLHLGTNGLGVLPEILERAGPLPASNAQEGERINPGHVHVAPPDRHLLLDRSGCVRVTRGPKAHRTRPAVDPLFRSAAHAFGPRVIGVILTGRLNDGAVGLQAVKARGGTAIVQHPAEAFAPSMPQSALAHVAVDHCVPLRDIAPLLVRLTRAPPGAQGAKPVSKPTETPTSNP
jgi:two-component system chemotaxis response regulator CheB